MFRNVLQYRTWLSIGVVVILAAAVIGTGVIIQKRGEHVRSQQLATTEGSKPASSPLSTPAPQSSTSSEQNSSSSSNKTTSGAASSSSSSSKQQADQGGASSSTATNSSTTTTATGSTSSNTASELPVTGPRENGLTLVAVAALTFAGLSYVRSRRSRAL